MDDCEEGLIAGAGGLAAGGLAARAVRRPLAPLRRGLAAAGLAALGLAALGLAASGGAGRGAGRARTVRAGLGREVAELDGRSRACQEYPYLKLEAPGGLVYSNLANQGPDAGRGEGMVLKAIDMGQGAGHELGHEVLIVVNATKAAAGAFYTRKNGISGKYGSIGVNSGHDVDIRIRFFEKSTGEHLVLPKAALTFFDLDAAPGLKSLESVIIGGFKHFHVTDNTEVKVTKEGNCTRFAASTEGTGTDGPVDPHFLTEQQKNRAVTLTFDSVQEYRFTLSAKAGKGARYFNFVNRPSLMCAVTVQEGFKPPLPDLQASPPLQHAVESRSGEKFLKYLVSKGDHVKAGDGVYVVTDVAGDRITFRAPVDGTVVALQDQLKPHEDLDLRLDNHTVVVIERTHLQPLEVDAAKGDLPGGPGDDMLGVGKELPTSAAFVKYLKDVGESVSEGDGLMMVTGANGSEVTVKAKASGAIKARQEAIKPGDPVALAEDKNLMNIGKYPALGPIGENNEKAAVAPAGAEFVEYKVQRGDVLKRGQVIAVVKDSETGESKELTSEHGGLITALQDGIKAGTPLNRVEDGNLATVGKFPPLSCDQSEETPMKNAEKGAQFVKYAVQEGDIVEQGDVVATVKSEDGVEIPVRATRTGVVKQIQTGLREGMMLDLVMQDANLATVGKLEALEVGRDEAGSFAPEDGQWKFEGWLAEVGEAVQKGDPIARLKNQANGKTRVIPASKSGSIESRQEHLKKGAVITRVMEDKDLAVIGKFSGLDVGLLEKGVDVPSMDAVFNFWIAKNGQKVQIGDPIAQVTLPNVRRLLGAEGQVRRLQGQAVKIPSPGSGTVSYLMPLEPGKSIKDQSVGPTIAKVNVGLPWWLVPLASLLVVCCLLCCLLTVMMRRAKPAYKPMPPPEEPKPEPVVEAPAPAPEPPAPEPPAPEPPAPEPQPVAAPAPEPQPDGLRLVFDDRGTARTVYAKYRPLGIKHNFQAPIVAHAFTINSYAKMELGVRDGWRLTHIGEDDLQENSSFEEVNGKLSEHTKDLPLWPLHLEFQEQNSSEPRIVKLLERPIGIDFANRAPIQVSKVHDNTPAQREGVQLGWTLTKIGEVDVHEKHNFHEVMKYLKEGVQPLDEAGKH